MSEENSIIGDIKDGLHKVEEAVEHLIHPDTAPSSSEPVQKVGGTATGEQSESGSLNQPAEPSGTTSNPAAVAAPEWSDVQLAAIQASGIDIEQVAAPMVSEFETKARTAVAALRAHLWTFERSTVAALHDAVDTLEKLI